MTILYILIGLIVGCCGLYLILRPKLKITEQRNEAIAKENKSLIANNACLKETYNSYKIDIANLNTQKEELKNSLNDLKETQTKAAENYYSQALEIAQNSFDQEIDNISLQLEEARIQAKKTYAETLEDAMLDFQTKIDECKKTLSNLKEQLQFQQKNVDVAVEAAKRKLELENNKDFYRICLSVEDREEIARLRTVLPYLRDKTPLNKVIYKVYYERPLTDMIGRVVGNTPKTGIYKITSLITGMCYVGQAANIADRWKQHVKRGVGAEDWTQNKLYPAMYGDGVEMFTFEIIEECDRAQLNEREDYWQEYFHAKDFGYSIK